jgi:histidinol-phosphate aminotransferase
MNASPRPHGGPDWAGAARWDFSTCANAAGPCPQVVDAIQAADVARYPDPQATALRQALAVLHGVAPQRVLLAASGSEFIQRITAVGAWLMPGAVAVPRHAYGDYAAAAAAWRRPCSEDAASATLRWCANPSSPLGEDAPPPAHPAAVPTVLDAAYAPLRLEGASPWSCAVRDAVFQLCSPNKALGLSGVRGAYAIAPRAAAWDVAAWCAALEAAAPSWPLSAQAEAMLRQWAGAAVQHWVLRSHASLRVWKDELVRLFAQRGFECRPSVTPHFCVRPPRPIDAAQLRARLRDGGVAVRDAASFGLPGWWRVCAQPPEALHALGSALDAALQAA